MSYGEGARFPGNEGTRHRGYIRQRGTGNSAVAQARIAQRDRRSVRTDDLAPVSSGGTGSVAVAVGVATDTIILQRGEDYRHIRLTIYGERTGHLEVRPRA